MGINQIFSHGYALKINIMKLNYYLLLVTIFFINCNNEHHQSNISKIQKYTEPINYTVSSQDFIQEDSLILADIPNEKIYLRDRKKEITSFECSKCHTEPLINLVSKQGGKKNSHWNIKLNHAEIMKCASCHDTSHDLNNLKDVNGSSIDFNQSYQLCAQCHSSQYQDWKGGAHGKRLASWAPPRVSYSCVECHNPHSPRFEKRLPSRHLEISEADQGINVKH